MLPLYLLSLAAYSLAAASCPCSLQNTVLNCTAGAIARLPDDLQLEQCDIRAEDVWAIELFQQPLTELPAGAFAPLHNLAAVAVSACQVARVSGEAFSGLPELRQIYLRGNRITNVEEGAFDLPMLNTLDLRENPVESFVTDAWHLCHSLEHGFQLQGDVSVFKHLRSSGQTNSYCEDRRHHDHSVPVCPANGGVLDCTSQADIASIACHIQEQDFTNVVFDFPVDSHPREVEEFYEGESNTFFQEFNSQNGDMSHTQIMKELTLYGTKFDLAELSQLTSNKTRQVILKADTVHITRPLAIDYRLDIQARIVALDQPIVMKMTKEEFVHNPEVEAWAFKEELVFVGGAQMRSRKFGLVTILDENGLENVQPTRPSTCQAVRLNSTETNLDLSAWYDSTSFNLHYVCARTVLASGSNARLAGQMADFNLGFAFNASVVANQRTFMAAQKFKRIQDLARKANVYNVPRYSVNTVGELAGVMHDRMTAYRVNEIVQEEKLASAMGRAEDMQVQFDILEQQQQLYFDMEQTVLESIWAATDNAWNFSFAHRNDIEDQIGGSLDAMMNQSFEMQQNELTEMLANAEASLDHMTAVVDKYKKQIERLLTMAEASMTVQEDFVDRLNRDVGSLQNEVDNFENAVEEWKEEQEAKAALGIFKAIFSVFLGFVEAFFDPEAIFGAIETAIEGELDILEMIEELMDVLETCEEIRQMLEDLDLDGLGEIGLNLGTDFKTSLQNAVDLKEKGPRFAEIASLANIKLNELNQATEFEIEGTSDLMMACQNVADIGERMVNEVADFADIMLMLADRNDEIAVAIEDKERATQEVERIKQLLKDLDAQRKQFEQDREQAKEDYENEINKMQETYFNMTQEMREEFRRNITAKFDAFKETFHQIRDNYQDKLDQVILSIQRKAYGLKEHSMLQRSMLLTMYMDYCDGKFYHAFSRCIVSEAPLMSDRFDLLLEKLSDIQWDSITADSNLPGIPISFGKPTPVSFTIEDDAANYVLPVALIKNNSKAEINLRDFDRLNNFDRFWRVRIDMLRLILLDRHDTPLPSPGSDFGEEIQVTITYPTVFIDADLRKNKFSFLAQNFFCTADYVTTQSDDVEFRSACQVDQAFSERNYQPSAEGLYTFYLPNSEYLDIDRLHKIKVEFSGSYIPYNTKDAEWHYE